MANPRRKLVVTGLLMFVAGFTAWFVPPVWLLDGGHTTVTQWHRDKGEIDVNVGPVQPTWIAASRISRNVLNAFVVAEDSRFYTHMGLDFTEIKASFELNLKKGRYVRGASTITQQVVKMAFLSRQKNLVRKMREAVGAVLLEYFLTKAEILEWYINLAEFGDGVYGIKQASWHYFRTKPELLTIQQAAHLALVLPSPNGWSKGLRQRDLTDFGHKRFAMIVNRMKVAGFITEDQWLNALATGNFGRPVRSYDAILTKLRLNESLDSEDLEMTEEELPLGIPFADSVDTEGEFQQSTEESHGQRTLDELIMEADIESNLAKSAAATDQPDEESNPSQSDKETVIIPELDEAVPEG